MAPSLTPSTIPTPATTTRHPTPDIQGQFCDHRIFQTLLSELSSCLNSGSPCCAEYSSFFSCPYSGQFDAYALSQFRLACRQTCSMLQCRSTAVSTTTTTQQVLTFPPIIPTIDDHDCSFNMLTSYQSELMDLANCLSGVHTISVHEGSSCCPRYRPILTSVCRLRLDASHVDEIRRTCSTICNFKDQHCPNDDQIDAVVTESVRLNGDFESIVAPNKSRFLSECSARLSPIDCIDARSGSIIIDLQGPSNEMRSQVEKIKAEGMQLPSYPALELILPEEGSEQKDESATAVIGITVALSSLFACCCCVGLYYYVFVDDGCGKSSHISFDEESKTIEVQKTKSLEGMGEGETTLHEVDLESMF